MEFNLNQRIACTQWHRPVTVVPHPWIPVGFGPEVGLAVVVDLRGEAQQAAVGVGGRLAWVGGQTVLLVRTLQHEHWPVLHVGGLLHHLRVQHQVRGRCRQEDVAKEKIQRKYIQQGEMTAMKVNEWLPFQTIQLSKDSGGTVLHIFVGQSISRSRNSFNWSLRFRNCLYSSFHIYVQAEL